MTDEPERVEDESLIQRLWDVGMHDWRLSHLAHTSDTAGRAAHEIERLRSLLSVSEKRAEEMREAAVFASAEFIRVKAELTSSQASLLRVVEALKFLAHDFKNGWSSGLSRSEIISLVERKARTALSPHKET